MERPRSRCPQRSMAPAPSRRSTTPCS